MSTLLHFRHAMGGLLARVLAPLVVSVFLFVSLPAPASAQDCSSPSNITHACLGKDEDGYCDQVCDYPRSSLPPSFGTWVVDTNFIPKMRGEPHLVLIQAAVGDARKGRAFEEDPAAFDKNKIKWKKISTVQDAITEINAAYAAAGNMPLHLVIDGHGRPGSIKVGEDRINLDTQAGRAAKEKFVAAVRGKLVNLTLMGCKVAKGAAGQALMEKLSSDLGGIPVHAWSSDLQTDNNNFWALEGSKKSVGGYVVTFALDGHQEVPSNGSTATGFATLNINAELNTIQYQITHNVVGPTAAHIHGPASRDKSTGVLVPFPSPVSPMIGTVNYLEANEQAILEGRVYVNIHSGPFPGGEIRGQVPSAPNQVPSVNPWGMMALTVALMGLGAALVLRRRRALS